MMRLSWSAFVTRHYIVKILLAISDYVEVLTFLTWIVVTLKPLDKEDASFFIVFQFAAKQSDHKSSIPESFN